MNVITLTEELLTFAEDRSGVQRRLESGLYGSALYALRHFDNRKVWYAALIAKASRLMRKEYRLVTGAKGTPKTLHDAVEEFAREAGQFLDKTKKPTPETIAASARAIAVSLSTAAVNAATEAAGQDIEEISQKTWVTMEDEKVRHTHEDAHGQTVALGEKFEVGGVKMSKPGDLTAPPGETINCRCVVALSVAKALVAAADMTHDGALIVMLPEESSEVHAISSEDDAHVTTIWFGAEDAVVDLDTVREVLTTLAPSLQSVVTEVKNRGPLGDDEADVLFLDRDPLLAVRDALIENETIAEGMNAVEQFPDWTPHVTLGYPETPANEDDTTVLPSTVTFDRLALWVGDDHSSIYTLGAEMADDDTTEVDEQTPPPLAPEDRLEYTDAPMPFWSCMAPEGIESGDARMFAADSLRSRPLPLPLAFQRSNEPGHDSSVKIGNFERMWRKNGKAYGSGFLSTIVPEVDEVIGLMVEAGGRMGVSVDADDGIMHLQTRDGRTLEEVMAEMDEDSMEMPEDIITVFDTARVSGATGCHIPAFHEAFIALGEVPEEFAPEEGDDLIVESIAEQQASEAAEPLAAAAFVKTEDGPGWLTHPVDTDRLRDYWVRDPKGLINWGVPGDFNRCRAALAEYVKPQHLSGYCANRHYDALGFWPGRPLSGDTIAASAAPDGATMRPAITFITAAGGPKKPPAEWFLDPQLSGPTPVTITEDGRVFGHVATWGTCHIGFPGKCVTPPNSQTNYAYFRKGATPVEGGTVPTGALTVGTGHADIKAKAMDAMAHYDNTGTNAANVSAGEDAYGIWIAGAVNPYATEAQVFALQTAALSGDWREIGGTLEMVAALAVNVPGFPIPRVALAASGEHQMSLVAAGIVPPTSVGLTEDRIKDIIIETLEDREAQQAMSTLRAKVGEQNKTEMTALAARRR